jgi:hypothetical protein
MAGLLDLIRKNRAVKMADGGSPMPGLLQAHAAIGAQKAQQDAAVQAGALSTVPPPLPGLDESRAGEITPGAVTPGQVEVQEAGSIPRNLEAGGHDLMGGVDNAIAAASAAVGSQAFAASMHAKAAEHAARAEELTPDQPKSWTQDVHGLGDAAKFGFGQLVRGAPMLGAMALGGGLARSAGAPALAGVAAPSALLNTGSAYGELADQPGVDPRSAGVHALAAGAVNAGLDTLAFGYASKLSPFAKDALSKFVSSKLTGHLAASVAAEGISGGAREYVNRIAVHHILANPDIFHMTDEDRNAIEDAAAQNVAATAPLGVAGHFGGRVSGAVNTTIDAAGKLVRGAQNVLPENLGGVPKPGTTEPSMGTKMGGLAAAVVDTDVEQLKKYGAAAVEALENVPGVKSAIQEGRDFASALGESRRVGKIGSFLSSADDQVRAGFDAFKQGYGTPETGNIEGAYDRYKTLLAHSMGVEGVDGAVLAKMTGEKLSSFISGFNEKLPAIESNTGAVFNTAKGVVGEAAGRVAGAVKAGAQAAAKTYAASKAETSQAVDGLSAALQPEGKPGVVKSLASALTPEQRILRDSLRKDNAHLSINEGVLLAKIFEPLAGDNKAFDAALAKPGVAAHIATLTDRTPAEFKQYVHQELGRRVADTGGEPTSRYDLQDEGKLYDRVGHDADNMSAEDGAHLANLDHSDVLNAVNSPNETGARHPGMSPDMFGRFLSAKQQVDAGSKAGGNAWVNVTRTTKDPDTGAVKGTETMPKRVNFVNLSKAWGPQREMSQKGKRVGESTQEKFDNNFKDGLSAMLNGWHETDEHGNPVDVTVQPANGKSGDAVSRGDMAGWLRPDSVVGTNSKVRTMADVEQSGKANAPVDLPSEIDRYHERVAAKPEDARKAAEPVARLAVERIQDNLDNLEPQRQSEVVQASIDYASDPTQRPIPKDVPSMLRMLPAEILEHGKPRLIAELSDLQAKVEQRMKGEQETSVDNPDVTNKPQSTEKPGKVTEDLAGQHIEYAKPGQEKPVVPSASKDEALANIKRTRAQATTETGKRMLEQAMQVVAKQPMSQAEYARLASAELKPSDVREVLGAERSRVPAGRSGAEEAPPKA